MTTLRKTIAPIPNMNGDTHETLMDALMDALKAMQDAEKAVAALNTNVFHGRNWQCNPVGEHDAALVAQRFRQERLAHFREEIHNIVYTIFNREQ